MLERVRPDPVAVGLEGALGDRCEPVIGHEVVELEEHLDGDAGARRRRLVGQLLGPGGEGLAALGREVERAGPLVPALLEGRVGEVEGEGQRVDVGGGLVGGEGATREEGVVLEVAVDPHVAGLEAPGEAVAVPVVVADEGERVGRDLGVGRVEDQPRFGEGADHQAVPARQDLLVPEGPGAGSASLEHQGPRPIDGRLDSRFAQVLFLGQGLDRRGDVRYRLPLEVARLLDAVSGTE